MESQAGPSSSNGATRNPKPAPSSRKRKSTEADSSDKPGKQARARKSVKVEEPAVKSEEAERKPRLTTPDLEFDFDRTQLRDPRPTPGRVRRPRYSRYDMPSGFKERFHVPVPEKPKGRLNASQKNKLSQQATLLDPSDSFHDTSICLRKGRNGSPTYDAAGFQLDWRKVSESSRPRAYNKARIVKGMERSLDRHATERDNMYRLFFVDGQGPTDARPSDVVNYIRDHVSKDLGVPWHQIDSEKLVGWETQGFPKQKAEDWWREPNEVEKARILKMMGGGSQRKDL
ncbi:hypothetical protein GGR54DRAFT_608942 [Hypoxylon sp. NC1633]|nr:hypothetical protein GGR54DRAFT_608942 [Hypoxylon sp. NC1633]